MTTNLDYPSHSRPSIPSSPAGFRVSFRSSLALLFPEDLWAPLALIAIHAILEPHLYHPLMDYNETLELLKDAQAS